MAAYTHLTDSELVSLVEFWPPYRPPLTPLERELYTRLANAVDTIADNAANLVALQAKYAITDDDILECDPNGSHA